MGVISLLGKIVLYVVNMLMLLIGIACFVIGVIVASGTDVYNSLKSTLEDKLNSAATSAGVSNLDTSNLTISDVAEPLAYGLIAIGIVVAALAILGIVAVCCTFKVILIPYTIVISVIFLAQLIVVILIYADKSAFDDAVKPHLRDTLKDFQDIEGTDSSSLIWNAIMNYESCCGVDNYLDFHDDDLKHWPPASINGYTFTNQKTPIVCCKSVSTNYACAEDATATDLNNNQNIGCYKKIYDMIMDNGAVISAFAIILALQAVLIFFSIWILCTMDNKIDII